MLLQAASSVLELRFRLPQEFPRPEDNSQPNPRSRLPRPHSPSKEQKPGEQAGHQWHQSVTREKGD